MRRAAILLACLLLCGCSRPTIDASSKDALAASLKRVKAGLSEAQAKTFAADCTTLTMGTLMRSGGLGKAMKGEAPSGEQLFRPLDGLTTEQVHTKAEEFRATLKK